jgi:hypothetical protein
VKTFSEVKETRLCVALHKSLKPLDHPLARPVTLSKHPLDTLLRSELPLILAAVHRPAAPTPLSVRGHLLEVNLLHVYHILTLPHLLALRRKLLHRSLRLSTPLFVLLARGLVGAHTHAAAHSLAQESLKI